MVTNKAAIRSLASTLRGLPSERRTRDNEWQPGEQQRERPQERAQHSYAEILCSGIDLGDT